MTASLHRLLSVALAVVAGFTAAPAAAASFDCAKASTDIEHTICDNGEINSLDGEMGRLYRKAEDSLAPGPRDNLIHEQRGWIQHRDYVCGGRDSESDIARCLKPLYERRIHRLKAELGEPHHHYHANHPQPSEQSCGSCQYHGPDAGMGCAGYTSRSGCVSTEQCSWVVSRCN